MTLCPIAIMAGCSKCPAVAVCPLKGIIGDYTKQDESRKEAGAGKPVSSDRDR